MKHYFFYFSFLFLFLFLINSILYKLEIFIHKNSINIHKIFGVDKVPLSGGVYFFFVIVYLSLNFNLININYIFYIFLYLALGLVVDQNINLGPKFRFILQSMFTFFLVYFNELYVLKTNIFLIDYFLDNRLFLIFFTSFCIMVLINGTNFIDGVNNNVSGLYLLIIFSLIIIEYENSILINIYSHLIFLISILIFHIFNFFNRNYLGDSGAYILSVISSILIISFINKSHFVSPILAVNIFWYPAFETLFSIIRKIKFKINPFFPDSMHMHTLILRFLKYKKIKNYNSLSGFIINLFLIPNFIMSINFFNNTKILFITTLLYIFFYILIYIKIYNFLDNKKLFN